VIWYEEQLNIKDAPEDTTIYLIGAYEEQKLSKHRIAMLIKFIEKSEERFVVIQGLDPKGLAQEDPSVDDVLAKYQQRIGKMKASAESRNYKAFSIWIKGLSSFIRGHSTHL